jgi:hypothetical protein
MKYIAKRVKQNKKTNQTLQVSKYKLKIKKSLSMGKRRKME